MKFLDRLPIPQKDTLAQVGAESVRFKKDQIIVWVSLALESVGRSIANVTQFPAILDTGHTHNFAIQNQHLIRWAGIRPDRIPHIGHIRHAGKRMPLYAANVWLHRNRPGTTDFLPGEPLFLKLLHGIAVFPDAENYPRLPLLGMRAILSNNLHLAVDGEHASVNLRTPDWRTRLLTWLA